MKYVNIIKENFTMKSFLFYVFRWQLSTPILGYVMALMGSSTSSESYKSAVIANLVGSLIFYWVDIITFNLKK